MGSSYQLKFSTSKTKRLNKKKNNGHSRSFKQPTEQNLSIFCLFFLERNCLLNSGLHVLDLFWVFAFIRHNFALILCYFLSLSESSVSDSYMLSYANAHIFQVVPDVLLGATSHRLPKVSLSQKDTKGFQSHKSLFWRPFKELSGVFNQFINASYITGFKPSWLKWFSHKS